MSTKKALKWVAFWVSLALTFNLGVYLIEGPQKAMEFFGGYIIEQSLSLDNLFLFLMIFTSFGIGEHAQRRALNYGIMGAVILRAIFILLGVTVVNMFHWILYVFGFILIFNGLKMMLFKEQEHEEEINYKDNILIKLMSKIVPISDKLEGEKFFVRINKVLYATPLLAIVVMIEGTDIIFAIDSIPAIFSISTDPFIVYTSNIFAILGLRCMYFVLEHLNNSFKYVKAGVSLILTFTGIKLAILMFHVEIPILLSLFIIFGILVSSIVLSLLVKDKTATDNDVNA
jgi:tellurite resistance protein TerC